MDGSTLGEQRVSSKDTSKSLWSAFAGLALGLWAMLVYVPTIIICIKAPPSLCKREEGMTLTLAPFYDF